MSELSRIIPNLEVLEPRRLYDASAAFTAVSISSTPIGVQAVYVDGTHWTQAFRDELSSETPPEVCRSCAIYSGTF